MSIYLRTFSHNLLWYKFYQGKKTIMRKKILTALLTTAAIMPAMAQNLKPGKLSKEEKKILQQRIDSALFAQAETAINDTAFTLEANQVVFKSGDMAEVTPSTNFVAVNKGNAVVQLAMNTPLAGANGMGGITVSGQMSGYKISKDKKGNVYVQMSVSGNAISAQVFITLWNGSNTANISVQPNFNSNRMTLNGNILPYAKSHVIQGNTL